MKHLPIAFFVYFSLISFGQAAQKVQVQERIIERNPPFTLNDTTINVINTVTQFGDKTTACFINSEFADYRTIMSVNPDAIKDTKILKRDTTILGKDYSFQLLVKTHDSIPVNLMSLSDIKLKYTELSSDKCIYILNSRLRNNEDIITNNPDLRIDKNYIFRIKVEQLNFAGKNPKKSENVDVIRILFRTKENIEEANQIWIK